MASKKKERCSVPSECLTTFSLLDWLKINSTSRRLWRSSSSRMRLHKLCFNTADVPILLNGFMCTEKLESQLHKYVVENKKNFPSKSFWFVITGFKIYSVFTSILYTNTWQFNWIIDSSFVSIQKEQLKQKTEALHKYVKPNRRHVLSSQNHDSSNVS